jgi:osmoprotectant transport system ATP-binding protein
MIRFAGAARQFGGVTAVDRVDLEVRERELCVLVGPSGSGKSTMLRMVNRLIEPSAGSVSVGGRDVRELRPEVLRRGIGYVIQSVGLFPHLDVAANVATVPRLLGWEHAKIEERVDRMLALVGMDPARYRRRFPHELSGGEAQRVGVARALASDPPIVLMDEPFSAVDPLNRARLQDEFLSIQRELKKTVLFVTHDVDEAIRLADRIAILRAGRLVQYDAPEKILESPADPFVAAFVGADRALKRLSRFAARDYARPAEAVRVDDEMSIRSAARERRFLWIADERGVLMGSLDTALSARCGEIRSCVSTENIREMAVTAGASLKEALSRMLGTSARTIPVVDGDFRLVGELSLRDVEAVSERPAAPVQGDPR